MTIRTVDHRLVELALARVDTNSFEKFVHAFSGTAGSYRSVPLGGMHDGGADGFVEPPSEHIGKPTHFIQTSKTDRIETKIRQTVKRLRDFGRTVERLTYYSSQSIPLIDRIEDRLGDDLEIVLKVRDASFIVSRVNTSPESVQAFNSYLYPCLSFLKELGGATSINQTERLPVRNLCVFLSQELERRSDRSPMLDSVVDSLILWSLEGTDPSRGLFLSMEAIQQKIEEALPAAKQHIRGSLRHRMSKLSSKGGVQGREINWHAKEKGYCLPYTTRRLVELENTEDEILKHAVSEEFRLRIATIYLRSP